MTYKGKLAALVLLASLVQGSVSWARMPRIEVEALLPNTAVLKIDGQRKTLRVGQSHAGVTLVAAYSRTATLEIDGERIVVGISRRIGSQYAEPAPRVVSIQRDDRLQYHTAATINDRRVEVMVDTGANVVAMNSSHARSLGLAFRKGKPSKVETASGVEDAWIVTLHSVDVGGIVVNNVKASVMEGEFPATILLGMTFLQHVEINETNGVLSLSRAW